MCAYFQTYQFIRQTNWSDLSPSSTIRSHFNCKTAILRQSLVGIAQISVAFAVLVLCLPFGNQPLLAEDITFARPDVNLSIEVTAEQISHWKVGGYEVLHLKGNPQIDQGRLHAESNEIILLVEIPASDPRTSFRPSSEPYKVIAYLEGDALIELPRAGPAHQQTGVSSDRIRDDSWFGRLFTSGSVNLNVVVTELDPANAPPIFARARQAMERGTESSVGMPGTASAWNQQASFVQDGQVLVSPQTGNITQVPPTIPDVSAPPSVISNQNFDSRSGIPFDSTTIPPREPLQGFQQPQLGAANSRVNVSSRDSAVALDWTATRNPANPSENIAIIKGGVRLVIDSRDIAQLEAFRKDKDRQVVILADSVVAWIQDMPDGDRRWEMYLEGNVVFSKDSRVIYSDQMYYDEFAQRGTILNADMLTRIPESEGFARLKANVVEQVDANNIQAYGAAFTTSRLGVPRYWLQSDAVQINRQQKPKRDPVNGGPMYDPQTGDQEFENEYFLNSDRNMVYFSNVPIFFWPRLQTSLSDPTLYLKRFRLGNDRLFGFQAMTGWDMYKVLGLGTAPEGVEWLGILDYLSDRGVGFGSEVKYELDSFLGFTGDIDGQYKSWFINDRGLDRLGRDRVAIPPEQDFRGRLVWNHRHRFYPGYQVRAELGWLSDRNFLEQYYEREWDNNKDLTTGIWLERNAGTQSFNLLADVQLNDFFTQTSWLPRFDHFMIGQPLLSDRVVWHNHSHVGYARIKTAEAPVSAAELAKFDPLAWEGNFNGLRAGTRQELDFPVQLGPVKVVPYVLGDTTFWQEDITGNDLFRAYGQTGIRASLPFWKVDPTIQSTLWNVNGLAHKITFDIDAYWSDASQNLDELPLYDQLDDDAQEQFRRRFAFDTFGILPGGNTPLMFDERYFALRSGMQGNVTASSAEIADDLAVIKLGARQRWQTKRGAPGHEHIIDWITLDSQISLFPEADRDNFGSDAGLLNYDFRWHIGDRFALLSDGYFDFFNDGFKTASVGMQMSRPETGNVYVGYRSIDGPFRSNVVTASMVYRMSDKWGVRASSQYDFDDTGTVGQTLNMIYIGESFLWQFGVNADLSRNNVGFRFGFEPRFLNRSRIFRPGGTSIPPAGSRWLE